ncbi:cysteine-rich KTR domain-containing protein [Dorea formicigenerans]|uniref:Conjugal transfer protein n=1 Tax=Dorea formicigenerans TaxID=39486 RepID=A0A415UF33_9FIRM|nr:cysteine-rich KTR domain-containing protein [Dorea formicigenerans]RHN16729.1 conjugal transfer protein [Dorea formicigenerans]
MNANRKNSLWIHCPICGGKTRTKVYDNTVLVKFPLYCPKCKKEIKIDVIQLKTILRGLQHFFIFIIITFS